MPTPLLLHVPLALVSVAGLLINLCVLVGVLLTRQVSTAGNVLLLHLGAVNAALGALGAARAAAAWASAAGAGGQPDGAAAPAPAPPPAAAGAACALAGAAFALLHPLALWTVCGLNCDRFYVIAAPLHYARIVSPRKVLMGLGAGWAISAALCVPPFFTVAPYAYIPGIDACAPHFSDQDGSLWYAAAVTMFTFLLPATVIICCNLKILMIARYHRHRIASAIYEVTLSAQVTITHQRNPFFVPTVTAPSAGGPKFRGRSAIYSVVQLVGSLLILYLPYYTTILWQASVGIPGEDIENDDPRRHWYTAASAMLVCAAPINGFLYGFKSKILRKTFKNYWRKKQTKSEVNQEIQARTPSTCGSRRPSLTPMGFFSKPTLQRRLSETLLEVNKAIRSPHRSKIKRIASELTWRPSSANSLNLSPKEENPPKSIKQTTSCNTLQVPTDDVCTAIEDEIYLKLQQSRKPTSPTKQRPTNMLQKFFGGEQEKLTKKHSAMQNIIEGTPKRSPRILITRAYSEESDKSSQPGSSPQKEITKRHSSSATNLLERKWRQVKCREEEGDGESVAQQSHPSRPLLEGGNRSSDSSETSDGGSGRILGGTDKSKSTSVEHSESESNEDQLLLSWNSHKKYKQSDNVRRNRPTLLRQTLVTQEIVL